MRVMYDRCAGIDVHKNTVVVCILKGATGGPASAEVRTFLTMTQDLLRLRDWLEQERVTHVAMESTGVYWKPVYNVLEGGVTIWVVNAQDVKNLPGRKTDVKDCEWLADLLRHGLVKPSFVPDAPTRDLRELTRYRTQLLGERSSETNRIHKILESANIKLGSILTDVVGVSGRAILDAIVAGETAPERLAALAVERVRVSKGTELVSALDGHVRDHHRFMLKMHLAHIDDLNRVIDDVSKKIEEVLGPFKETLQRLDAVPGVARRAAEVILAEIGTDMSRFGSAGKLASWAGICPGNNQSAGKRLSGRTRKGSPWLRAILIECAWGAARTKDSYLRAQYVRLKGKRGSKKAAVAVAHSILVVIYHLMSRSSEYRDLGADYFERRDRDKIARRLTRRLRELGFDVILTEKANVA